MTKMTIGLVAATLSLAPLPAMAQAQPDTAQTDAPPGALPGTTDTAQTIEVTPQRTTPAPETPAAATRSPANPAANPYPNNAIGENRIVGGYATSRWGEDWRKMAKAENRHDFLDRLKYLPLNAEGDIYLTLSGEVRIRTDILSNTRLIERPVERRDRLRLVGGADLHIGPHVRFYGELAHGGLSGVNLSTTQTNFVNDLVVQQAFGEVSGTVGGYEVGARVGRQEFVDGSSLLVNTRDFNNIRFVLNGVRGWARGSRVRADLFDFAFTTLGAKGLSDDPIDDATRFGGVNLGFVLPEKLVGGAKMFFDPYVWRLRQDDFTWGGSSGRDLRRYYGGRLWGTAGRFTIDWTVNYQDGSFAGRPIRAGYAFLLQLYRLGAKKDAPSVGFHVDYASGGGAYGNGTLHDATTPFGANSPFSYQIALTPTNLLALTPGFNFTPFRAFEVNLEYQATWRVAERDAVYRPINRPYVGTERVPGYKTADLVRMQTRYPITRRLFLGTRTEYLKAGPVLTRAGYADSFFTSIWLSFRL